jgi:hypothetical protein
VPWLIANPSSFIFNVLFPELLPPLLEFYYLFLCFNWLNLSLVDKILSLRSVLICERLVFVELKLVRWAVSHYVEAYVCIFKLDWELDEPAVLFVSNPNCLFVLVMKNAGAFKLIGDYDCLSTDDDCIGLLTSYYMFII